MSREEVVLATTEEEAEEEEEEGGGRREACVVGGVLEIPVGEGRIGREYVRSAGVAVEVSLGRAGTRMWGEGAPGVAVAILGPTLADTEGAGVSGGGGEDVVGVSVGVGESRSLGLGVSRGGVGVVGVEASGVVGVVVGAWGLVPLVASPTSDWLGRTGSLSILQHCWALKWFNI